MERISPNATRMCPVNTRMFIIIALVLSGPKQLMAINYGYLIGIDQSIITRK